MIYFNRNKEAHAYEIPEPTATVDSDTWMIYSETKVGVGWDIIDGVFTPLKDIDTLDKERETITREQERRSIYIIADEHIAKCDNYIDLELQVERYTTLKRQLLEYKMAVRETQNHEDFPFEVVYPDMPEDV